MSLSSKSRARTGFTDLDSFPGGCVGDCRALSNGTRIDAHVGELPESIFLKLEGQGYQRAVLISLQNHRFLPFGHILQKQVSRFLGKHQNWRPTAC